MFVLFGVVAVALTACATNDRAARPAQAIEAAPSVFGAGDCDAARARAMIGRVADARTIEEARQVSGSRTVRAIAPESAVTMDYRTDRLNLETDGSRRIIAVRCG